HAALSRFNPDSDWEDLRNRLAKQYLAPLEGHLQGINHLVVLPSGRMWRIPIESFSDRYRVSYAPSATVYARLRERKNKAVGSDLLAVGDAFYTADQAGLAEKRAERLTPLPGTSKEIEIITRLAAQSGGNVQAFLKKQATLGNLEKLAE